MAPIAKRGVPVYLATFGLAAVGGGVHLGIEWATHSPRFAVAQAEVQGTEHLPDHEIRHVLAPVLGTNLFSIDTKAVARKLRELPWIEEAQVGRRLPNRLTVRIVEHEPAALVALGGLYLADASGHPFKRAAIDLGEGAGLLTFTGLSRDDYRADPESVEAAIRGALEVARLYQSGANRPELGEIHIDTLRGFTLVLAKTGSRIHLGRDDNPVLAQRLGRFDTAWAALAEGEREHARSFFIDNETRQHSVTIAFAQ